jgi:hypothetical protein
MTARRRVDGPVDLTEPGGRRAVTMDPPTCEPTKAYSGVSPVSINAPRDRSVELSFRRSMLGSSADRTLRAYQPSDGTSGDLLLRSSGVLSAQPRNSVL